MTILPVITKSLRISSCLLAAGVATLWVVRHSNAQDKQRNGMEKIAKIFKTLDVDADGLLSPQEAKPYAGVLKGADANGDGVSLPEALTHLVKTAQSASHLPASPDQPYPGMTDATADSTQEAPQKMKPTTVGVGKRVEDIALKDAQGKEHKISELMGKAGLLVVLVDHACPVGKKFAPTLCRLETEWAAKGIAWVPVSLQSIQSIAKPDLTGLVSPLMEDPDKALQLALGALTSTETFLLDTKLTLKYRGAVSDQYGVGYSKAEPQNSYLAEALAACTEQRDIPVPATTAPGCELDLPKHNPTSVASSHVTFHHQISRIIQANCQECHHTGGLAPFPLETLEQVKAKAGMIRRMVTEDLMPPWFAAHLPEQKQTPWKNDKALTATDKSILLGWLASERPAGDEAMAPLPKIWKNDWIIGTPEKVYQIPQPIAVKAEGTMGYQNVKIPVENAEELWVQSWEVQPTARQVVHHVLIFATDPSKPKNQQEDGEHGGFLAAFVPGNSSEIYPPGYAKRIPPGAVLHFQIHYTPNGSATQDQVRLGLKFTGKPQYQVHVAGVVNSRIAIPPNTAKHAEMAALPVPETVRLLALSPHMHVRGKAFRYDLHLPDGQIRTLLDVPKYDFNWQLSYRYKDFLTIPKGSQIKVTGWYDNSSGNPSNPDPNKLVKWGQQTQEEMLIGYVEYVKG